MTSADGDAAPPPTVVPRWPSPAVAAAAPGGTGTEAAAATAISAAEHSELMQSMVSELHMQATALGVPERLIEQAIDDPHSTPKQGLTRLVEGALLSQRARDAELAANLEALSMEALGREAVDRGAVTEERLSRTLKMPAEAARPVLVHAVLTAQRDAEHEAGALYVQFQHTPLAALRDRALGAGEH
eukprot:SAG22_NODE_1580_length_4066_cov_3.253844_3_plen_187_part_00